MTTASTTWRKPAPAPPRRLRRRPRPRPTPCAAPRRSPKPGRAQAAEAEGKAPEAEPRQAKATVKKKRKRRRSRKFDLPAWAVSLVVHVAVLMGLAAFTFTEEGQEASSPTSTPRSCRRPRRGGVGRADADLRRPVEQQRSDQAVGNENAETAGGGGRDWGSAASAPGRRRPRPVVARGRHAAVSEKTSLPGVKIAANVSGLSLTPAAPGLDLGGGGMIAGDVTYEAKDVGASLDQIAREILRHLTQHKLTVVWLFDESESMKDDQKAIRRSSTGSSPS